MIPSVNVAHCVLSGDTAKDMGRLRLVVPTHRPGTGVVLGVLRGAAALARNQTGEQKTMMETKRIAAIPTSSVTGQDCDMPSLLLVSICGCPG